MKLIKIMLSIMAGIWFFLLGVEIYTHNKYLKEQKYASEGAKQASV